MKHNPVFKSYFVDDSISPWICPFCNQGQLHADTSTETPTGLFSAFNDDADSELGYTPLDDYGAFARRLKCSCKRTVLCCGKYHNEEREYENGTCDTVTVYEPLYFVPSVNLFRIPDGIDPKLGECVKNVFSLFWTDLFACGNAVRTFVERLMDVHAIPTEGTRSNGQFGRLDLHDRIKLFRSLPKAAETADSILALKWIGNFSSHGTTFDRENLILAVELIEKTLEALYGHKSAWMKKSVALINATKRPL